MVVMGPGWTMTADGWMWLAIWVAALLVMVWFITHGSTNARPEEPLEILRRRFARGEISEAEYQRALQTLELDRESHR